MYLNIEAGLTPLKESKTVTPVLILKQRTTFITNLNYYTQAECINHGLVTLNFGRSINFPGLLDNGGPLNIDGLFNLGWIIQF